MKRFWCAVAATALLSACGSGSGGNPFAATTTEPESGIPDDLKDDLDSITYDPVNMTLTVSGISLDDTPYQATYTRTPRLDTGGYEAYITQDGSLDRHVTAYVRDIGGTRAAIVVTGGQFAYYFGGSIYARSGAFDPPTVSNTSGIVTYAGNYVGLTNGPGDGSTLLPVAPGTPPEVLPVEAGEVEGRVAINADFVDNVVNGLVYDRVYVDGAAGGLPLVDLELAPTNIEGNGTFVGDVTINHQDRGTYGGVFGGTDSTAIAGTLYAQDHIDGIENEEEFGLFVLDQCGTPNEDALCNQPVR